MAVEFTGADGWPCAFEDWPTGRRLIDLISGLNPEIEAEAATAWARRIYSAANNGKLAERPHLAPASEKKSEAEIQKIINLAARLKAEINGMHAPAFEALQREGLDVLGLDRALAALDEIAHYALSDLRNTRLQKGAPPKHEAAFTTETARLAFEAATGKRATFTTCPSTGQVSGDWPNFLQAVFEAARIDASVASQVRR